MSLSFLRRQHSSEVSNGDRLPMMLRHLIRSFTKEPVDLLKSWRRPCTVALQITKQTLCCDHLSAAHVAEPRALHLHSAATRTRWCRPKNRRLSTTVASAPGMPPPVQRGPLGYRRTTDYCSATTLMPAGAGPLSSGTLPGPG